MMSLALSSISRPCPFSSQGTSPVLSGKPQAEIETVNSVADLRLEVSSLAWLLSLGHSRARSHRSPHQHLSPATTQVQRNERDHRYLDTKIFERSETCHLSRPINASKLNIWFSPSKRTGSTIRPTWAQSLCRTPLDSGGSTSHH